MTNTDIVYQALTTAFWRGYDNTRMAQAVTSNYPPVQAVIDRHFPSPNFVAMAEEVEAMLTPLELLHLRRNHMVNQIGIAGRWAGLEPLEKQERADQWLEELRQVDGLIKEARVAA